MRKLLRVKRKAGPIDSLLTPIRQAILFATYGQPDRWWYLSELASSAGTSPSSLQRELSAFVANGLLERKRDGGRIYFKAATNSPFFYPLKELLERALGPVGALSDPIEPLFFKHKGHDGHKGKRKESRLLFAFVYFVPFVVKLFPVDYGRPYSFYLQAGNSNSKAWLNCSRLA